MRRQTVPAHADRVGRMTESQGIRIDAHAEIAIHVFGQAAVLWNPWMGYTHRQDVISAIAQQRSHIERKGHIGPFVFAQKLSVEPNAGEVVGAIEVKQDSLSRRRPQGLEVLAVPPLLLIDAGEFFCLAEEILAFEPHLQLYVARHLDAAKSAFIKALSLRPGRDSGIYGERAEQPIAAVQRLLLARCGGRLKRLCVERNRTAEADESNQQCDAEDREKAEGVFVFGTAQAQPSIWLFSVRHHQLHCDCQHFRYPCEALRWPRLFKMVGSISRWKILPLSRDSVNARRRLFIPETGVRGPVLAGGAADGAA